MKTIRVAAAIICNNLEQIEQVYCTQRGYGEFAGGWEFPGGKIEEGETSQEALTREIKEELDTEIEVGDLIDTVEYDYPNFHLSMDCFLCVVKSGELVLKEHSAGKWCNQEEIDELEWLPADLDLIKILKEKMNEAR